MLGIRRGVWSGIVAFELVLHVWLGMLQRCDVPDSFEIYMGSAFIGTEFLIRNVTCCW